jgi:hypothetical protein
MEHAAIGKTDALPLDSQVGFVAMGVAQAWGLPDTAAWDVLQLLKDAYTTADFVETTKDTPERSRTGRTDEFLSFEPVDVTDQPGVFADTTWELTCAEEIGGRVARRFSVIDEHGDEYLGGQPGVAALACRSNPDWVLWLGFDSDDDVVSWPEPAHGGVGWIWIGPTWESALRDLPSYGNQHYS